MGFFWEGLPPYLLPWSVSALNAPIIAVETGTFRGDTTALLADAFGRCVTIERSSSLAETARQRFENDPRVTVLEGSSSDLLASSLPDRGTSLFVWLDAHGVYDFEGVDPEENPLIKEIATLLAARDSVNTIIAIDDARGMGTQPGWPSFSEIATPLANAGYTTVYLDDVFLAVPKQLEPSLWPLYQLSRTVEATALFHIWPRVMRAGKIQAGLNKIVTRLPRRT